MKITKNLAAAFALTIAACAFALPPNFTEDLDAAFADAKTSGKLVFACFSGSDWCPWCQKLDAEVFSQDAFASATNDFNLVYIDVTRAETPNKAKNLETCKKYDIKGFPTVLIFDAEGRQVGKTGYSRGGAEAYLKNLEALKKAAVKESAILNEIAALEAKIAKAGEEEAEALRKELSGLKKKNAAQKKLAKVEQEIKELNGVLKDVKAKIAILEKEEELDDKGKERLEYLRTMLKRFEGAIVDAEAKKAQLEAKAL